MKQPITTDQLVSRRIRAKDGTTVNVTYKTADAKAMRAAVAAIRLRGDKQPSLSLIARRSIGVYLDHLTASRQVNPAAYAQELATLERMTAPLCPKTLTADRLKARDDHAANLGVTPDFGERHSR